MSNSNKNNDSGIYLICFDKPLHHARHYLGWSSDISSRLLGHASGRGSALMAAVVRAGISYTVSRTWPGATRTDERKLKSRNNIAMLCPRCRSRYLANHYEKRRTLRKAKQLYRVASAV